MATTLADLIQARSAETLKAELLTLLAAEDFPVTDWHEGGVERTLVEVDATVLADVDSTVAAIAAGGQLDNAEKGWLTLYAKGRYGLDRTPAVVAVHEVELTDAASAGPFTITPGQLWFSNAGGMRFTNVDGGTLDEGGTLTLQVRAESPGAAYNVGLGTITNMLTPLPGVTVTNTAVITSGTDEETDAALKQRCRDRWGELGIGGTAAAYRNWAQEASDQVTRVLATPSGADDGTVDVLIAGAAGAIDDQVDIVQAFLDERVPLSAEAVVASATNATIALVGTVYVTASQLATAKAQGEANIAALAMATEIGGNDIGGGAKGIALSEIIGRLMAPAGVRNVVLSAPLADVVLDADEVPEFDLTDLSWEVV